MKSWSITQARANISDVFDAALTAGPQRIERRDSIAEFQSVVVPHSAEIMADIPNFTNIEPTLQFSELKM